MDIEAKGRGLRKADWLLGLTGAYCVISVMMNLLCTKPMSFGTGFVWMDGGLLISWIVFLISNVVTEVYGKRTAIVMAGVATVVAFFVNVVAAFEVHLPTLPEYADQADHFVHIFSNGPRTILSSAIAFFVGNAVNCEIIDRFRRRAEEKRNDNGWRFDIVVNNAGVQTPSVRGAGRDIRVNLCGAINVTERYAFQPQIKSVLFNASASGVITSLSPCTFTSASSRCVMTSSVGHADAVGASGVSRLRSSNRKDPLPSFGTLPKFSCVTQCWDCIAFAGYSSSSDFATENVL